MLLTVSNSESSYFNFVFLDFCEVLSSLFCLLYFKLKVSTTYVSFRVSFSILALFTFITGTSTNSLLLRVGTLGLLFMGEPSYSKRTVSLISSFYLDFSSSSFFICSSLYSNWVLSSNHDFSLVSFLSFKRLLDFLLLPVSGMSGFLSLSKMTFDRTL